MKTLAMLGYLQNVEGKRYRLGWKVLDLGFNALGRMDVHTRSRVRFCGLSSVLLTLHTPVTIAEIEARLRKVRELGYARSDQDRVVGVRVIAAPVFDRRCTLGSRQRRGPLPAGCVNLWIIRPAR